MSDQTAHKDPAAVDHGAGYETRDVNMGRIFIVTLLGIVVVVATMVIFAEVFLYQTESEIQRAVLAPESMVLRDLRAGEDEVLNSYGIVDTIGVGIYRIPIDRAMVLVAEEAYATRTEKGD